MKTTFAAALSAALTFFLSASPADAWQQADGPLKTRWAREVSPGNALPEYPRPQLVRKDWLNLNGLWEVAVTAKDAAKPAVFQTQILVPFPIESALSGVMKHVSENDRIWYRRTFTTPNKWRGQRVLLHFGAVDFEATVWVNGQKVGEHRGGYDGFEMDITDALNKNRPNELVVSVWDPTDAGTQPRGKQVRKPGSIWYTSTSGIWQTVWLEPVNAAYIMGLKIVPDVDAGEVVVRPITTATLAGAELEVSVADAGLTISSGSARPGEEFRVPIKRARLWSPESPFLYHVTVTLKLGSHAMDKVESYFGMRKISIGKDDKGFLRLFLNNKPYFQIRPARSRFLARRRLYRADRRSVALRHRDAQEAGLQHGPQACEGRAGSLVLLVRQAGHAGLAGHAERRQMHRPPRTRTSSASPESASEYRARSCKAMIEGRAQSSVRS